MDVSAIAMGDPPSKWSLKMRRSPAGQLARCPTGGRGATTTAGRPAHGARKYRTPRPFRSRFRARDPARKCVTVVRDGNPRATPTSWQRIIVRLARLRGYPKIVTAGGASSPLRHLDIAHRYRRRIAVDVDAAVLRELDSTRWRILDEPRIRLQFRW